MGEASFLVILGTVFIAVASSANGVGVCHGEAVPSGQFPWLARITRKEDGKDPETVCTGSIIGPRHVLTAAHCFVESKPGAKPPGTHHICFGGSASCSALSASSVCVNPTWNPMQGTGADLAIVTLEKPLSIAPITLISNKTAHFEAVGEHVILAGFGYECPGFPSGAAQYTDKISVIERHECSRELNTKVHHPPQPLWNISEGQVCTQDSVSLSGAAIGDSGGPLFHKTGLDQGDADFVQIATVHGGQEQGTGLPDVYQRILPNIDWVDQVLAGQPRCLKSQLGAVVV